MDKTLLISLMLPLVYFTFCESKVYSKVWNNFQSQLEWQHVENITEVNIETCSSEEEKTISNKILQQNSNRALYLSVNINQCRHKHSNLILQISKPFQKGVHLKLHTNSSEFDYESMYNITVVSPYNSPLKLISILLIDIPVNIRQHGYRYFDILREHKSNLKVVQLKGPAYGHTMISLYYKFEYLNMMNALSESLNGTTTLEMLVLDNYQGHVNLPNFVLNMTKFLSPIKSATLRYLAIRNHGINFVTPGISILAPNLQVLDLYGNNILNVDSYAFIAEALLHPYIQVLTFEQYSSFLNVKLKVPHIKTRRDPRSLADPLSSAITTCMKSTNITKQDIWKNKQSFCKVQKCMVCEVNSCPNRLLNMILINLSCDVLDLPQSIKQNNFGIDHNCFNNLTTPIGVNLTDLKCNKLLKSGIYHPELIYSDNRPICFGRNKIKSIQIRHSGIAHHELVQVLNQKLIKGLEGLKELDLSDDDLFLLNLTFSLSSFPNLNNLYASGNRITLDVSYGICLSSPRLEIVDLSRNKIFSLPKNGFKECLYLTKLLLSQNNIKVIDFYMQSMFLTLIDISNNPIANITSYFTKQTSVLVENQNFKGQELSIDLQGITLVCSCAYFDIINWMQSSSMSKFHFVNYDTYECILSTGGRNKIMSVDISTFQCSNTKHAITIIMSNIGILVIIGIIIVLYKYRYRIYTFYVMRIKRKFWRKHDEIAHESQTDFDAFVCYCAADRFWVHNVLMTKLEEECGFKLCLHYRDFPLGGTISNTILEYMDKSAKIIYILSDESIKCEWTTFELEHANINQQQHGKPLILLKFGNIPSLDRSNLVSSLLDGEMYIEWPDVIQWQLSTRNSSTEQRIININDERNEGNMERSSDVSLDFMMSEFSDEMPIDNNINRISVIRNRENSKSMRLKEEVFWAKLLACMYGYVNVTPACFCCIKTGFQSSRMEAS